ncbi:unnamed protein product [Cylindrotheca closterium]|uniref:FAS1 domain-containing protein n=1 Tax=Cylindrotheca closterium TaxID=2856 RepID=A0AAD2CLK6_9STRA|nr:unnamed protein product [Cylindrotheca closterium]
MKLLILATTLSFFAAAVITPTVTADLVAEDGKYEKFLKVLSDTPGLLETVSSNFPLTMFGPTDAAFDDASDVVAGMSHSELAMVFANHAMAGVFTVEHFKAAGCSELMSLTGGKVRMAYHNGNLMINEATVIQPDLIENEGVFHGIDEVVLPGSFAPCSALKNSSALTKGTKKGTKKDSVREER